MLVKRSQLTPSAFQRERSDALVRRLVSSLSKGFFVPVVVVEADGEYIVIDGQHRLRAADYLLDGDYTVPVIRVPSGMGKLPLYMNIERSDSIKDKAYKIYRLYMQMMAAHPEDWTEEHLLEATMHNPPLFTIAFAYCKSGVVSPSLVESLNNKLDTGWIRDSLCICADIRQHRGDLLRKVEIAVGEVAETYGIRDSMTRRAMLSQVTMSLWGRKRNLSIEFDDGIAAVIDLLQSTDWSEMQKL
ncbi:MAG TPA: DUF262 domain-containing protein [Anaerolineales bacterium]|nr:DUF262 domain-containing protein [Anaerolineales bacterium]